ncbi:HupE/UreJ family protein [Marinospirillum perlucidum]|uniref:HupE/UreJ family protein n=1 Tax=Marinospirillum perlucidum TaxID=1982602 RepID=UPI000DF4B6B8|nr:HupE/UreJ family protein [Marinospirillum perlucidum]
MQTFPAMTRLLAVCLGLLLPGLALAHTGDHLHLQNGFLSGLLHPLSGWDHLLAMITLGLLAGLHQGRMQLLLPACFLVALLGGYLAGLAGVILPWFEVGIAASLLIFGLLVTSRLRLPAAGLLFLAAGFAAFHGSAHGVEAVGNSLGFGLGLLLASLLLHLTGVMIARSALGSFPLALRGAGVAVSCTGLLLLI